MISASWRRRFLVVLALAPACATIACPLVGLAPRQRYLNAEAIDSQRAEIDTRAAEMVDREQRRKSFENDENRFFEVMEAINAKGITRDEIRNRIGEPTTTNLAPNGKVTWIYVIQPGLDAQIRFDPEGNKIGWGSSGISD